MSPNNSNHRDGVVPATVAGSKALLSQHDEEAEQGDLLEMYATAQLAMSPARSQPPLMLPSPAHISNAAIETHAPKQHLLLAGMGEDDMP